MKTIYLAQMMWCEREQPIVAGTNKRKLISEALKILKAEHGTGPVCRGQAMCALPITADDIEIVGVPMMQKQEVEMDDQYWENLDYTGFYWSGNV
jgi:hypothetical protein